MIEWQWRTLEQLHSIDVYEMMLLRQQVFILEQNCRYEDIDGYDRHAYHLLGWQISGGQRQLTAYLRCIAPGVKYSDMSLGRVLTRLEVRGSGVGKQLLEQGIRQALLEYPGHAIRIGAQHHLERFYQDFGFQTVSAPYDEDGISHIDMRRESGISAQPG